MLLLHGFPELAYSWRKVMLPLAAAGYHVIAPDVRGYGRTSGTDVRYDDDLAPFRSLNQVRDMLGLVSAFGYRSVGGGDRPRSGIAARRLVRAGAARRVPIGGDDERAVRRSAGAAVQHRGRAGRRRGARRPTRSTTSSRALTPPRKHYQRYYTTREANENMWHAPQGIHAFLRAYYHMKSADWKQNHAGAARGADARASGRSCRATT